MSILISGGRIITAADDYVGDIFIDNEHIALIGESLDVSADRVIDASGKYVLPGGIDVLVKEALAKGNGAPKYHSLTRPPETEGEATNRAIQLARIANCPVYIVHVSCEDAIEPIERAREKGWDVWGETCTQYLMVDFSKIDQPGFEGAKYVYTPPPRESQHVEACWEALRTDKLSVVSTDHAPFNFKGQKDASGTDDFSKIPNGPPGIEERLKLLHEFGVRAG